MAPPKEKEIGLIWQDTDDLNAIYDYVRNQRPKIDKYPHLLPAIQSFESWFLGLGWYDKAIMIQDTYNEAVRRRIEINKIMGQAIPDNWVPHDAPQTAPPKKEESLIPTSYKIAAVATVAGVTTLVILKKFSVL